MSFLAVVDPARQAAIKANRLAQHAAIQANNAQRQQDNTLSQQAKQIMRAQQQASHAAIMALPPDQRKAALASIAQQKKSDAQAFRASMAIARPQAAAANKANRATQQEQMKENRANRIAAAHTAVLNGLGAAIHATHVAAAQHAKLTADEKAEKLKEAKEKAAANHAKMMANHPHAMHGFGALTRISAHAPPRPVRGPRQRGAAMSGLGANPAYGTKAWWQWYATSYLPQFYNRQQAYNILLTHPLYSQFGLPSNYTTYTPPTTYGYPYQPSAPGFNYPYYGYGNQYSAPYTQYQHYIPYGGTDQGAQACNAQGGIYDAFAMSCSSGSGSPAYGNTVIGTPGALPNIVGQPMWSAVSLLNAAGYNVWLLNQDGVSQGSPPGYDPRRVDISVNNGVVSGASVG